MEAVKVDGGQDIGDFGSGDIQLGQQFDLPACDLRLNV